MVEPDPTDVFDHGLVSGISGKISPMYGSIIMIGIASVVVFVFSHSWAAGLGAGLLALLLILAFSAFERFFRGVRSRS